MRHGRLGAVCRRGNRQPGPCGAAAVGGQRPWRRAGSAAFRSARAQRLAPFAMPVFVRVLSAAPVTDTFKHVKVELRAAGADPTRTGDDALFVLVPLPTAPSSSAMAGASASVSASAGVAGLKGIALPEHSLTDPEAGGGADGVEDVGSGVSRSCAYAYVPLTLEVWHDIVAGRARL